jgi:membrane associated rhomboid family serine protease
MVRTKHRCTVCGKPALYRCKYCGDTLCKDHLSPGMHWCVGLEDNRREETEVPAIELEADHRSRGKKEVTNPLGLLSSNCSYLLLALISVSFLLQSLIPGGLIAGGFPNAYEKLLLLNPQLVMERPWTLVTHIFLHGSFMHFFINLLVFFFFAPTLERKIGSVKFLLIFFLSGIFAGIGYSLTSDVPSLGASGAVYGVLGTLAVLMPKMKVYIFPLPIPLDIWIVVILFALYFDVLPIMMGSLDMVAHTAHLSGLLFGLFAGMYLKRS